MPEQNENNDQAYIENVAAEMGLKLEKIYQLETTVDDVTGETLGNLLNKLMGTKIALDVNYLPLTMKHSRPGILIQVLTKPSNLKFVLQALFSELGTLGIRINPMVRIMTSRDVLLETVCINDQEINVRIKRSWSESGLLMNWKPENEDVIMISKKLNIPTREVLQSIYQQVDPRKWTERNEDDE